MSYLLTPPDFPIITRMNPFKYHTVELRRLWDVTLTGLELNGISAEGLGEKHMDKFVLRGGLNLSQYSLSLLPPHLGGFSTEAPVDMSDRTATFIDAINTASPAGFKGSISTHAPKMAPASPRSSTPKIRPPKRTRVPRRPQPSPPKHQTLKPTSPRQRPRNPIDSTKRQTNRIKS